MRYSLFPNADNIIIYNDLSIADIKVLLKIHEEDKAITHFGILPELEYGDTVMNIQTRDIGEVFFIDKSIKYIDKSRIDDIEDICGYVNIINSNHEMCEWKISDLIVITDTTIN